MTVLYNSPIFGPVHSRRLGVSLGINLLPHDGKCCTFDCIYCECGFNHDFVAHDRMPTREQVVDALRNQLIKMQQEGPKPDVLTFAGNGEPTMHPHFPEIVDEVIALRNEFFPEAKVSVLSNATQILRQSVFDTLLKVDNNILKLDTVSNDYIRLLDRPVSNNYDVNQLIAKMAEFKGHCIVQTMFLKGEFEGRDVSNLADEYVEPWLKALVTICPAEVMIYTIDRETPAHHLQKASHEELDAIAARVEAVGMKCQVSY